MNLLYVKIGAGLIVLFGLWFNGYSVGHHQLTAYKLEQETATKQKEIEHQVATDQIRKVKDAQIRDINSKLVDAISELRKRPSRPQSAFLGQIGTGASLFAEDAIFLRREAARADELRTGLEACYAQYDAVAK
jgi:hypothetical protein